MKVKVHGKDLSVSNDMVERITYKLSFLDKYILIDDETTAQVMVKRHGKDIKLEITIPTKVGYLRSEVINHEIQDTIDTSIDKLEDQIRRQKLVCQEDIRKNWQLTSQLQNLLKNRQFR